MKKLQQTPSWATLLLFCVDAAQKLVPPPEFLSIIFPPCGVVWLLSILPVWMPLVKHFAAKGMKHQLQQWKRSRAGTRRESWKVRALRPVCASPKL